MNILSIVFQGVVRQGRELLPSVIRHLRSTRRVFPQAEIILSTWRHSPEADYELWKVLNAMNVHLVLSDDPGPVTVCHRGSVFVTNVNRMLRSSQAGLMAATRPFTVKLRTDTELTNRRLVPLLSSWVQHEKDYPRNPEFRVFRGRVINASGFARDARGSLPYLFHPGDILLAGYTDDVRLFFSAPLAGAELFSPAFTPGLWCAWRYVPEQWCWVHAIRRVTKRTVYLGNFHNTPEFIADSEQYFLANFVTFSFRQLGLRWPKYWQHYPLRGLFSTVTFRRWKHLAQAYAEGQPQRPYPWYDRLSVMLWRFGYRLRSRFLRIPAIRRILVSWFGRQS